jgi:hypothetical protein
MPWGRVDDTWYDHPKLEELEDAHEWPDRLAGAGLNSLAWSWCNRFLTDGKVPRATVAKLGGTTELADMLVRVGLWESAPGGYQIHDFLVYNDSAEDVRKRRAEEAARKAAWRAKKRPGGTDNGTSSTDDGPVPPSVPPGHPVPPGQPPGHEGEMSRRDNGDVPGFHARATRSANPDPSRPVPTRPTESLTRESRATPDRPDIQALRDRGFKRVTAKQRAVLDEVLARHDVTGPAFAAEVIRATPADADPLAAVMSADRLWQASQRKRADAEEQAWSQAKAQEKADLAEGPTWLTGTPEPAESKS